MLLEGIILWSEADMPSAQNASGSMDTTHPFQAFAVSNIGLLEWVGHLPSVSTCQMPGSSLTSGLSVLPPSGQVPFFFSTYPTL